MRVRQPRDGLNLGKEPLGAERCGDLGSQYFHGDVALVLAIDRAIDRRHAAAANDTLEVVPVRERCDEICRDVCRHAGNIPPGSDSATSTRPEAPLPSNMPMRTDPDVTIRPATAKDLPALGRLAASLVRAHYDFDPKRFIAESPETPSRYGSFLGTQLRKRDATVLVAEERGIVIGYVYAALEGYDYMALRGPAGVLHDIVVDSRHRKRGVGGMLLEAALNFLKSHGAPRAVLSTAARNEAAQRLFERAGFRRTMIEMTAELDARDSPD